jgi:hypothetical protein
VASNPGKNPADRNGDGNPIKESPAARARRNGDGQPDAPTPVNDLAEETGNGDGQGDLGGPVKPPARSE